jgi:hypothetical protein
MPDVYIDRYMTRPKLPPTAVWVAVAIPPNCPKPPIKRLEKKGGKRINQPKETA